MAVVINGQIYENLVQIIAKSNALDDDFIQGNSQVISFILDAKFTSTLTSLRCFPNLATFVIMNTDGVVDLNPNLFDGTSVSRIIVPNSLLSAYKAAYPAWASLFDTWQFQVEFTVEHIAGQSTTLTKEYIDDVVAIGGGAAQAHIVGKLIVDSDFTDYEAGALDYLFEVFNNTETIVSPWLNGNTTDGMEWTIPARSDTRITSAFIQECLDADQIIKDYGRKMVIPSHYTAYEHDCFYGHDFETIFDELVIRMKQMPFESGVYYYAQTYFRWGGSKIVFEAVVSGLEMTQFFTQSYYGSSKNITCKDFAKVWLYWGVSGKYDIIGASETLFYLFNGKAYLISDSLPSLRSADNDNYKVYLPYSQIEQAQTATNWSTITSKLIGFLDYDGTNIPTFSGYTATWYSDEDCTTPIATSAFVSGNRYFVKLTANA